MWRLLKEPFLATWKRPKDETRARWLLKEPLFDVPGSASGSGRRAVQVTAEFEKAAGRNLVAVKVFPVLEDFRLNRFRTCFRQHTFIKFEYRQANKLIGFERAFENIRL